MTHISKHNLDDRHFRKLFSDLSHIIATLNTQTSPLFFSDLFTEAEQVMFTKRLTAILLFGEGASSYQVALLLNMSPSTTDKLKLRFEVGAYKHVVSAIRKNKRLHRPLIQTLEEILSDALKQYSGKTRWKWLNELN